MHHTQFTWHWRAYCRNTRSLSYAFASWKRWPCAFYPFQRERRRTPCPIRNKTLQKDMRIHIIAAKGSGRLRPMNVLSSLIGAVGRLTKMWWPRFSPNQSFSREQHVASGSGPKAPDGLRPQPGRPCPVSFRWGSTACSNVSDRTLHPPRSSRRLWISIFF